MWSLCASSTSTALIKTSNVCRRLDYVYSADLISLLNAILHKMDKKYRGDIFNACSGQGHSAPKSFEMMKEHAGSGIGPRFDEPEQFWSRYPELVKEPCVLDPIRIKKEVYKMSVGDPTKTEREFGWRVTTGLKGGLVEVWKYTLANM